MTLYPEGMEDFIRSIAQGKSSQEITALVNEKYGPGTITLAHLRAYKKNHGIQSGLTGRFEKGHVPYTKGKTWDDFMSPEGKANSRKTTFKKGNVPHNGGTPIGALRLRKATRGKKGSHPYFWEKVADPNVWKLKHQLEWERHNGPIPDGCMVTFADGDTTNWHIDNLILETKAQHAIKNRHLGARSYDRESAEVLNGLADLKMAMTAAKKKGGRK